MKSRREMKKDKRLQNLQKKMEKAVLNVYFKKKESTE